MDWICFSCGKIFGTYKEKAEHRKTCDVNLEDLKNYRELTGEHEREALN